MYRITTKMKSLLILTLFAAVAVNAQTSSVYVWNITYSGGFFASDSLIILKQASTVIRPYSLIRIQFNYLKFPTYNNYTVIDQPLPVQFRPFWGINPPACNPNMPPGSFDGGAWYHIPWEQSGALSEIWILVRCDGKIEFWPPTGDLTYFSSDPNNDSGFVGGAISFIGAS